MPTQVRGAFQRILHAIREFTVAQRTLALIGLAVLVVAVVGVGAWLSRPQYAPLYSGLSGSDASAIVEQLESSGVPYELANGGTTILVPQSEVDAQRLAVAAEGLPSSTSGGYALLDSMGVTASEFQQSVTYKRALEGELANTISAMKGVDAASVQLAIPEESVFVEEQAPTTASVFLELRAGEAPGRDQIVAIQHLVSSAVPGLAVEDVSIVDAEGALLSADEARSGDALGSDYENRIRASVQSMLDRIVGVGNATVAVSAEVETESAQRTEETFSSPEDGDLALVESEDTEAYGAGDGDGATGVLGPDNIAVPNGDAAADGDGYSSSSVDRTNAINKVTEVRTIPAGSLERQTVSIAIDEGAAAGIDADAIESLVAAAAGIDEERGDVVTVEVVEFSDTAAGAAQAAIDDAKAAQAEEQFQELLRTGIIALASVLVIVVISILVARLSRRRTPVDVGELVAGPGAAAALGLDALDDQPAVGAAAPTMPLPAAGAVPPLAPQSEIDRVRAEIEALARTDPQRTAEYLRGLMDEPAGPR